MRGWISRRPVPRNSDLGWEDARLRVDGGAPYMYEPEHGLPQYKATSDDSPFFSFPLLITAALALRVVPAFHKERITTEAEIRSWGRVALPDAGNSVGASVE